MKETIAFPRIGVDLGGTKIEVIILDSEGNIRLRRRTDTPKDDYQAVIDAIVQLITVTESEAGIEHKPPVGIGTPGAISHKTGRMKNSNSTCLNGRPLVTDLSNALARPVRIANDADCLTLSEASDGAAAGARTTFGVILGTGVGGGIAVDGRLLAGANAICGEWGHNTLPVSALQTSFDGETSMYLPTGRECFCGRLDCVETWIAGPGFERSWFEHTGTEKSAPDIVQLASAGEAFAQAMIGHYCNLLALALSNVINIIDPDVVVIGGGMSNIAAVYEQVVRLLPRYVFSDQVNTRVVKARHGDSSGVRGAAWLWQPHEIYDQ